MLISAKREIAAPSSKTLEGSGTDCGGSKATCEGAVIELSIASGTISLMLKLGRSARNSLSCNETVNSVGAMGGKATKMLSNGTGAELGDTASPGSPGPKIGRGGADAGQSPNPAPVLAQTIAEATILIFEEW